MSNNKLTYLVVEPGVVMDIYNAGSSSGEACLKLDINVNFRTHESNDEH